MSQDRLTTDYPDIQVCTCANLRRATRMVTQTYDAALRPAGLKATQFTMLAVLAGRGQMRQTEFAQVLGMDGTTLTRNLQPLLKKQWIQIERDDDQRVRLISITDHGQRILDDAIPLWQGVQSQLVTGLGNPQWSAMMAALSEAGDIAKRG